MQPYKSIFSAIILLLSATMTAPATAGKNFIKPYRLSYTTTYKFLFPVQGSAIRELVKTDEDRWQLNHLIDSPMIKLRESSLFNWDGNQANPVNYHYRQRALTKKREVRLQFDWPNMSATNTATDKPIQIKLLPNSLDKLNYQLQLRHDLGTFNKPGVYQVVDRKRLKEYRFEMLGEELLETAVGKLNTVKLKRSRGPDASRETLIWLAKDWDYLLVKIQQEERGKSYEIMLSEGELDGTPITGIKE